MLRAYFDESGTHQSSPVVCIAGYISTDVQWRRFNKEWKRALDHYSVDFFHMKEFENRKAGAKQFRHLDNDQSLGLQKRLISTIRRRVTVGFGVGFTLADYEEVVPPQFRKKLLPYRICAEMCLYQIGSWARRTKQQGLIPCWFDAGADHSAQFFAAAKMVLGDPAKQEKYRLESVIAGNPRTMLPLQAADMIAYETYKALSNKTSGTPRTYRESFKHLIQVPHFAMFPDKDRLRQIVSSFLTPKVP